MENEQADAGRESRTRLARPNSQPRKGTQGRIHFQCSADHEQDWQPYPVDPYSAISDDGHTNINSFMTIFVLLPANTSKVFTYLQGQENTIILITLAQ